MALRTFVPCHPAAIDTMYGTKNVALDKANGWNACGCETPARVRALLASPILGRLISRATDLMTGLVS